MIVAVGGDGNFIRTAQIACKENVPLFGVNCGRVGFLTECRMEYPLTTYFGELPPGQYRINVDVGVGTPLEQTVFLSDSFEIIEK